MSLAFLGEALSLIAGCAPNSFFLRPSVRFVWDGDQVLYELRYPGGDDLASWQLDWKPPQSASPYVQ
ncbi:MAG: hypothetical protein GTN78_11970, partial [Gemmatimonadales bacterium]|nr:hypothetical protein [Gemmatimonadales bacterium]